MDLIPYSGSSKQRRDLLKNETDCLGRELPFDYGKVSQLRICKAACNYLKKEKYFSNIRSKSKIDETKYLDSFIACDETLKNEVYFNKSSQMRAMSRYFNI